jgi:rare lipoprotein A
MRLRLSWLLFIACATVPPPQAASEGLASWYGRELAGRPTASGEPFDPEALTAAHRTLPFGTCLRVQLRSTGREVEVRINDRGPFTPGRVLDLSARAARELGLSGVEPVVMRPCR